MIAAGILQTQGVDDGILSNPSRTREDDKQAPFFQSIFISDHALVLHWGRSMIKEERFRAHGRKDHMVTVHDQD